MAERHPEGTSMTDRELLELAARAAGIEIKRGRLDDPACRDMLVFNSARNLLEKLGPWNPLTDDGDALRLAVKLNLNVLFDSVPDGVGVFVYGEWDDAPEGANETYEKDGCAATRRAITRAAAEIGKALAPTAAPAPSP
jgi:hypothetical protein